MSIFTLKPSKTALFSSILAIFTLIFIISTQMGCMKSGSSAENNTCTVTVQYVPDRNTAQNTAMVAYCVANNITYTTDTSGILYQIITAGATAKPTLCETLSMTYTGKLLNGTQFDAGTIDKYSLSQLIVGWQIAVPKIGKGGRIKILIPSSLGYGSQGAGSTIPPNSPLYFDIVLN